MKAPAIHRRKRAEMSVQRLEEVKAILNRVLSRNFPPGYEAVGMGRSYFNVQQAAQKARADGQAKGAWYAEGYLGKLGPNSEYRPLAKDKR